MNKLKTPRQVTEAGGRLENQTEIITYIRFTRSHMNSTNDRRCVFVTPVRLRQRVVLFGIRRKQMSDWSWLLLEFVVHIVHVHLIVFLADLIR